MFSGFDSGRFGTKGARTGLCLANTKARGVTKRKGEVRMRTTLWVTTAAAALIAGATFAGAQTGKTNESGASSGSSHMSQGQGSAQKGAGSEQKGAASEQKGAKPGVAQGTAQKGAEGKQERSSPAGEKAQGPTAQQGQPRGMAKVEQGGGGQQQ